MKLLESVQTHCIHEEIQLHNIQTRNEVNVLLKLFLLNKSSAKVTWMKTHGGQLPDPDTRVVSLSPKETRNKCSILCLQMQSN